MLKKLSLLVLFSFPLLAVAQQEEPEAAPEKTWSYMTGSMIYFYKQTLNGQAYNGINTLGVYGFRYNFKNVGKGSVLSVGSVPGLGLAFYSGYNSSVYFSFDLPLLLEFHTGLQAKPFQPNEFPVGFFAGGGMGINYMNKEFYLNNPKSGFSYGPVANAGIKVKFGGQALVLRGSFLYNLNRELPDLKGIGILWSNQ